MSETAQNWSGAKPSVLLQLWKDTLAIAKELNLTSYQEESYQANIYRDTYSHIARHRQTVILDIDKAYNVVIPDESVLHSLKNELPSEEEVLESVAQTNKSYPTEKQMIKEINAWYNT